MSILLSDSVFWFCALSGTGMFVIQFLLSLFGGDVQDDGEIDTGKFKWLSKQTMTGFLMMFGWVGLTCKKELNFSDAATVIAAFAGGSLALFLTASIFKAAKKLCSSSTVFKLEEAVGKEAMVYQRIPKWGAGKITLSMNNLTYEIDAISRNGEQIPSFTQVQIIKMTDEKTVLVIPT